MGKPQSSHEYFMNSNTKSMLKGSKRKKWEKSQREHPNNMQESRQYRSHAKRLGSHWNCPSVRQAELIWMLNNGLDIQKFHIYAKGFSAPWIWPIRGVLCHHTPSCRPMLCLWVYDSHTHTCTHTCRYADIQIHSTRIYTRALKPRSRRLT